MRFMPERINGVLPPGLLRQARQMTGIQDALQPLFAREIETGRMQAVARDTTLVLICADRGMATEVRFQQREALKVAQAAGWDRLQSVQIRMSKDLPRPDARERPAPPPRTIPDHARKTLETAAQSTQDPQLASALQRLSRAAASPVSEETGGLEEDE